MVWDPFEDLGQVEFGIEPVEPLSHAIPRGRACAIAFADVQSPPLKSIILSARKVSMAAQAAANSHNY